MDNFTLILIVAGLLGVTLFGALAYVLLGKTNGRAQSDMRGLMVGAGADTRQGRLARAEVDPWELDAETLKKRSGSAQLKSKSQDISTKLFKAGFFTAADRKKFLYFRVIAFFICLIFFPIALYAVTHKKAFVVLAVLLGAIIGFTIPMSWLERQIRRREEDVLYYLPLVIEQISIGVSSALDIGPCVSQIVEMAGERDSHNPVTEMLVHVEKLIRSGLSLEDALVEVGEANGSMEVKHAFMFLAQCARHGGEISKQLQELADSVMMQRQVQIEQKITALPVKATGPLAMVFAGFFALLFAGLLVRLLQAFGG